MSKGRESPMTFNYKFATALPVLFITAASQANLLVNGSFENPAAAPNSYLSFSTGQTIGSGWVVDFTNFGVDVLTDGYTGGGATWPTGSDGNQYLYLADSLGTSLISQDVVLNAATAHSLTFDFATFSSPAVDGRVTVDITQGGVSVLPSGPVTFSVPFSGTSSVFQPQSLNFVSGVAGTYSVRFSSTSGFVANVDNVQLNVPAPAAVSLLGVVAAIGARRRTR